MGECFVNLNFFTQYTCSHSFTANNFITCRSIDIYLCLPVTYLFHMQAENDQQLQQIGRELREVSGAEGKLNMAELELKQAVRRAHVVAMSTSSVL